jgi:subtilisin-like proprotein convertase family protein
VGPRSGHRIAGIAAGLLAGVQIICAAELADRVTLFERGGRREFEIASGLRTMAPANSAEGVRQYGRRLGREQGKAVDLVLYESGRPRNEISRRFLTRQVLVKVGDGAEARLAEDLAGVVLVPVSSELPCWFLCGAAETGGALELAQSLRGRAGVLYAEAQLAGGTQKKLIPNDPFFPAQWHLRNVGQNGGTPGMDINVTTTWDSYRGGGVTIGIVDDGLQYTHPDLAANYNAALSANLNDGTPDPAPNPATDVHGTPVAGLAGARGNNGIGVSGVAPEAALAGLRLLGAPDTDVQDAAAALFRNDVIAIKNNSWGASDGSGELLGAGPLLAQALAAGATTGRGGRGTIFVFAGGNGLATGDDVNYDGYANSLYALAVTAVSDQGEQASYAEPGACLIVAAPSSSGGSICSGGRQHIATTDLTGTDGFNDGLGFCELPDGDYTEQFGGTSASAAIVSGVVALLLQANPNLNYRDVGEILLRSARKVSPGDPDWWTNAAGIAHNHKFGAGLVDAGAAVALATNWAGLGPRQSLEVALTNLSIVISDSDPAGITCTFTITNQGFRVERVALLVTAPHPRYGDLAITLVSPSGIRSRLAEAHGSYGASYEGWTLTTVRHWGEQANGVWKVQIADQVPSYSGTLQGLGLVIQGSVPQPRLVLASDRGAWRVTLLAAAPAWIYLMEGSDDLATWSPLSTLKVGPQGRAAYVDLHPPSQKRFYRARLVSP